MVFCLVSGMGNTAPTAQCAAGFYCPGGQSSSTPAGLLCLEGHYCEQGSAAPTYCPAGEYQTSTGQSSCDPCPAGYYCDPAAGRIIFR